MGMMVCALALLGCRPADDTTDAGIDDAGTEESGMDAPFAGDTGDAPHETVILYGSCTYVDYGSTCHTSCDLAPEIPIQLVVVWSEPYCCGFPTRNQEPFYDCRCLAGEVRCNRYGPRDPYIIPTSTCEGCRHDAALPVSETDAGA